ncbi:hypothetical protein AB1K70_27165, partial [Bremerella sp. JC770]|uniref:hypothetical protein n=1 Tax=Bremerella sp. JC770 TaxID=3232137 RepID=UPI0034575A59
DWTVDITATDNSAEEYGSSETADDGMVRITRTGETDLTHSLYVTMEFPDLDSTSDFQLKEINGAYESNVSLYWDSTNQIYYASVSIDSGETYVDLKLIPNNDSYHEDPEEIDFELRASCGCACCMYGQPY